MKIDPYRLDWLNRVLNHLEADGNEPVSVEFINEDEIHLVYRFDNSDD